MSEFDQFAGVYRGELDRVLSPFGAQGREFTLRKVALIRQYAATLGPLHRLSVLDIGCGSGDLTHALAPHFTRVHGVEPSDEMLRLAGGFQSGATFTQVDEGEPLPFPDGEFDLAFLSCVLHHVPSSQRCSLLSELRRVVRPGGLVLVIEHNPWNPVTRKIVSNCSYDQEIEGLLSVLETRRLLKTAGLAPEGGEFTVFFPGRLAPLRPFERFLKTVPLGGQYLAAARVPSPSDRPIDWSMSNVHSSQAELSLVLPFFNEETNVEWVIRAMLQELHKAAEIDFELVCVNNGSLDDTGRLLAGLAREHPQVQIVDVFPNRGFGWGVQQGLNAARGRLVSWMGGDGQNPPIDVVSTYRALRESTAHMAKVKRVTRGDGPQRKFVSVCWNLLFSVVSGRLHHDANGTPKVFERRHLEDLKLSSKDWFLDGEVLLKAHSRGWKLVEVPVDFRARRGGSSNVRTSTLVEFMKNLMRFIPAYWLCLLLRRPL